MTTSRVALYTFGVFRGSANDPANQGFHDRNDLNFRLAEASEGYIARSGYEGEPGPASWGKQVFPRFYVEMGDGWAPSTLSLWKSIAAPMAYSYAGGHAEALKHGRDWFVRPEWPPYVLWWVGSEHVPDWAEAVARLEWLHDHGTGPEAFDFKHVFDECGRAVSIDRNAVRACQTRNEALQRLALEKAGRQVFED